jgi:rubrerythrin
LGGTLVAGVIKFHIRLEKPKGGKMPEFANPFVGRVPDRKFTHEELIRAIRLNIAAEHEAIYLYTAHADATDHPLAKKILIDIADEERVHIGEFEQLLQILTGDEDKRVAEGREEVEEMAAELAQAEKAVTKAPQASGEEVTLGSLKT